MREFSGNGRLNYLGLFLALIFASFSRWKDYLPDWKPVKADLAPFVFVLNQNLNRRINKDTAELNQGAAELPDRQEVQGAEEDDHQPHRAKSVQ